MGMGFEIDHDAAMQVNMDFLNEYRERERLPKAASDLPEIAPPTPPTAADAQLDRSFERGGGSTTSNRSADEATSGVAQDVADDTEDAAASTMMQVAEAAVPTEDTVAEADGLEHNHDADASQSTISQSLTDHRDAAQDLIAVAASVRTATAGTGTSGKSAGQLPQTGFFVQQAGGRPRVVNFPKEFLAALNHRLITAAQQEHDVSAEDAQEFVDQLSQDAKVIAFVAAMLELPVAADAATVCAWELFRSGDPSTGRISKRLDQLTEVLLQEKDAMQRAQQQLQGLQATSAVVEQLQAYSIAATYGKLWSNIGDYVHDAPLTHRDAVALRNRARDLVAEQRREERRSEGRPIR